MSLVFSPSPVLRLSDLDDVARDARKLTRGRWGVAAAQVALSAWALGVPVALAWGCAVGVTEGLLWLSTGRAMRLEPMRNADRLRYLGATVLNASVWLALSLLFWTAPEPGSQIVALLIWSTLLINAVSFAFRSPLALAMFSVPVLLVMLVTPIVAPRFTGPQQVLTLFGLSVVTVYAMVSARRNVVAAQALSEATAALEVERSRAQAANVAKSDFLATMSHEIRTPLNGVIGMAQAMARDELPSVQRERLTVIQHSGESLLALLNDVLDLARIESGRFDLEDGVVDAAELARAAQAAFAALAADKDIYFVLEVAPEARGLWRGDPARVRQILHNLIGNAVKFTASGSVQVAVSLRDGGLCFSITDTGPGVPEDRRDALFEKFVQVDASTTRQYGGSGLGLPICRELATLMGGGVTLTSVVGQGSSFVVRLPLQRAEAPADVAAAENGVAQMVEADLGGLRVLVAEDNPMNQLVIRTLLSQFGVEAVVVSDGAEAVRAFEDAAWDVILMDVQMPVMDGPTAARRIRERERAEGRARTAIIALTANAMAHQRAAYIDAGMDLLVAKPIQVGRLIEAIDLALDLPPAPSAIQSAAA